MNNKYKNRLTQKTDFVKKKSGSFYIRETEMNRKWKEASVM